MEGGISMNFNGPLGYREHKIRLAVGGLRRAEGGKRRITNT